MVHTVRHELRMYVPVYVCVLQVTVVFNVCLNVGPYFHIIATVGYIHACVYVCMYVCMYVVSIHMHVCVCVYVCMYVCC
jgi:hypothetical protein